MVVHVMQLVVVVDDFRIIMIDTTVINNLFLMIHVWAQYFVIAMVVQLMVIMDIHVMQLMIMLIYLIIQNYMIYMHLRMVIVLRLSQLINVQVIHWMHVQQLMQVVVPVLVIE